MAKNEEILHSILKSEKGKRIKSRDHSPKNTTEINRIYKELTGTQEYAPLRVNNIQIKIDENKYLELDDQSHFNEYRLITLNSEIYNNCHLFNVEKYKKMCERYQTNCLKEAGTKDGWKTSTSEKLFLKSNTEKDLTKNGSSRWKQKAFNDFVKDVYAIENKINLKRISVWETIKDNITIKQILDEELTAHYEELKKYILAKFD